MSRIVQATDLAGAAPVIARLPVAFSPAEVGISHRNKVQLSETVWGGSTLRHQSNDPDIARTTLALAARLRKFPGYLTRTVDTGAILSAMNGGDASVKSGRRVSALSAFAQLGAVPFVRLYVTAVEVESLLQEKYIAGVDLDVVTRVSDDQSLGTIGIKGWTSRDEVNGWWEPAVQSPPLGRGAIIAVSDTGIESAHPSFRDRVVRGACFEPTDPLCDLSSNISIASGAPCQTMNSCSHGTQVAGVAAGAEVTLSTGRTVPRGVAPSAQLVSYRTCGGQSAGGGCIMSALISALGDAGNFISQGNNVVSFNMSHGLNVNPFTATALITGISTLMAADVVVVQAGGNDGDTNHCDIPNLGLVVVANMVAPGRPASSTNYSPTCTTLWAPGTNVEVPYFVEGSSPRVMATGPASGTSIAAPQVSGAVALVDETLRRFSSNSEDASVRENFSRFAGFADSSNVMSDTRTECEIAGGLRPCVGSRVVKPILSLRSLVAILQPAARFRTLEGDFTRYSSDIASGTPTDWRRDGGVSEVLGSEQPISTSGYSWGTSVWVWSKPLSAGRNTETVRSAELRRAYVVVENGTVSKFSVNGVVGRATAVSRGPRACTTNGWYEVWRLDSWNPGATVEVEISGPKSATAGPRGDLILIESRGQATVDEIPISVSAAREWSELPQRSLALTLPQASFSQFHADLVVAGRGGSFGGQSTLSEPLREDETTVGGVSVTTHLRTGSWGGLRSYGELRLPSIDFPRGNPGRFDCVDVLLTISHWW